MFKIFITFISTVQINSEESVPQEGLPDDLTEEEFNSLEEVGLVLRSRPVHGGRLLQQLKGKILVIKIC